MTTRAGSSKQRLASILIALGAAGLWAASRMVLLTATVADDKGGDTTKGLVGATWDAALTPVALAMLAALVLSLALQPVGRRIVGAVVAALAGLASFRSVQLLTNSVDLGRVKTLLTSGTATQRQSDPVTISDWATITGVEIHTAPILIALGAAAAALIGGALLAMQPGGVSGGHSRYATPETRRADAAAELAANPSSSQVLWDAMDAGVDPTDDEPEDEPEGDDPKNASALER